MFSIDTLQEKIRTIVAKAGVEYEDGEPIEGTGVNVTDLFLKEDLIKVSSETRCFVQFISEKYTAPRTADVNFSIYVCNKTLSPAVKASLTATIDLIRNELHGATLDYPIHVEEGKNSKISIDSISHANTKEAIFVYVISITVEVKL